MKKGWEIKKLDDVCELITCGVAARPNYVDDGIPFLSAKNVKNGQIVWSGHNYVSKKTHEELTKNNKPQIGDILYTRVGSYGEAAVIEDDVEFSVFVSLTLIKVNKRVLNNYFLKHYLNSDAVKKLAKKSISGSGVGNLNVGTVRNFEIPLPSLTEQQRIIKVLDDVLVVADKAKKIAEKNLQNTKELFESYLQSIKAEKKPLGNLVDIKTGKLNSNAAVKGGKYPFFTCSREIFAINNYAFNLEAILLAGNNASGDFNVKYYKGKFNAYQRTYVITVNKENKVLYRYLYFQLLNSLKEFKEKSVGTNTRFLKLGMIQDIKIILPSITEQKSIVKKLDELSTETKKLEAIYIQKLADLEELKKAVLKKAFSGEL